MHHQSRMILPDKKLRFDKQFFNVNAGANLDGLPDELRSSMTGELKLNAQGHCVIGWVRPLQHFSAHAP